MFVDLKQGDGVVQIIVQLNKINTELDAQDAHQAFRTFAKIARKGDWYSVQGHPHRSSRGELSVLASKVPTLLSPSLHQIPATLEDAETRTRNRHIDMLVNPSAIQTILMRHIVEKHIADFFKAEGFTSVHTPILTTGAGGAVARPFQTEATELEGQKLDLRIAPELWLKRLVVGGLEKVYEIGPAFRNEGVDVTHNPEFYICEFYEAFATLEDLMTKTERLLCSIEGTILKVRMYTPESIDTMPETPLFSRPFERLEFLPTLEKELGCSLPDLEKSSAQNQVLDIFKKKALDPPSRPTLPRLLDALASHFLEPLCTEPTFIIHHPACLSPLSKHFNCPKTGQIVSARAELFIKGRELANMYEEENSPFEQRRKFVEQARYHDVSGDEESMKIDESYLQALEWGTPPTGGWGCGVDRLVMLFSGRERMSDVLAFGSLRNVVGLGRGRKSRT